MVPTPEYFDERYYLRGGIYENKLVQFRFRAKWLAETFHPKRALEIGSGEGCLVKCLSDLGVSVVGLDISRYGAYFLKHSSRVLASDVVLPFRDGSFDLLIGFDIMEHNLTENIPVLVKELARVAEPRANGFFNIALLGQTTDEEEVDPTHYTLYDREWWCAMLSPFFDVVGTGSCPTLTDEDAQFTVVRR